MSLFTTNRNPDEVKDYQGSNWINNSGMYDLVINAVILSTNDTGSQTIDLFVQHNGQDQMIFGAFNVTNKDGSDNTIGHEAFNKFKIVTGMPEKLSALQKVALPIGKEGADKEVEIFPDFCEAEVTALVKMEYSVYDGKIRERKLLKDVFDVNTHASAAEIANDVPKEELKQYAKLEATATKRILKDGLTDENIDNWIAGGRGATGKEAPKKPTAGFTGNRKFGNK